MSIMEQSMKIEEFDKDDLALAMTTPPNCLVTFNLIVVTSTAKALTKL